MTRKIYPHEFEALARLIQTFEEGFLEFLSLGSRSVLHISSCGLTALKDKCGSDISCKHFNNMAKELNEAIVPIRDKYLKILKDDMIKLAANYAEF